MGKYIIERRARVRLAWFERYEQTVNVSQVCREFGISRKTFYKWWPCYAKQGLPGLKDRSKCPKNHPGTVPKEIAQLIVKLRHKSHYGPRRLAFLPGARIFMWVKLSVYGVYRVLVRAGLVKPRKHRPRKKPHPFEEFLKGMGIRQKLIPIATPKQSGKVERSHRTDDEEFYNQRGFRKLAKRRKELSRFLDFYNNRRPHSALGWMTPLEKLRSFPEYQGVTHV